MKKIIFTLTFVFLYSINFACGYRNILVILINKNDKLLVEGEPMNVKDLKDYIKEFISNPNNNESYPEKKQIEIPYFGVYPVSRVIVSIQNDRSTTYKAYIEVNNEIEKAFNELSNELSQSKFGLPYKSLPKDKVNAINKAIPKLISEAEPYRNNS